MADLADVFSFIHAHLSGLLILLSAAGMLGALCVMYLQKRQGPGPILRSTRGEAPSRYG